MLWCRWRSRSRQRYVAYLVEPDSKAEKPMNPKEVFGAVRYVLRNDVVVGSYGITKRPKPAQFLREVLKLVFYHFSVRTERLQKLSIDGLFSEIYKLPCSPVDCAIPKSLHNLPNLSATCPVRRHSDRSRAITGPLLSGPSGSRLKISFSIGMSDEYGSVFAIGQAPINPGKTSGSIH